MPASTAHAGAPAAAPASRRAVPERLAALGRATSITRVEVAAVVLCLTLAALTLLFPSTPTYDPWSWIVWGRQILHGSLDTVEGPSWKPLPIVFTVPVSLFGDAAPSLWLGIARAPERRPRRAGGSSPPPRGGATSSRRSPWSAASSAAGWASSPGFWPPSSSS